MSEARLTARRGLITDHLFYAGRQGKIHYCAHDIRTIDLFYQVGISLIVTLFQLDQCRHIKLRLLLALTIPLSSQESFFTHHNPIHRHCSSWRVIVIFSPIPLSRLVRPRKWKPSLMEYVKAGLTEIPEVESVGTHTRRLQWKQRGYRSNWIHSSHRRTASSVPLPR